MTPIGRSALLTAALLLSGAALWLLGLWLSAPVTLGVAAAAVIAVLQMWQWAAQPLRVRRPW